MMHHFILSAELRVLIPQSIEAVRACRHNRFDPILIERRHILFHHHLSEVLITKSPGRVSGAFLFVPKDGERDSCSCSIFENACVTLTYLASKEPAQPTRKGFRHPASAGLWECSSPRPIGAA